MEGAAYGNWVSLWLIIGPAILGAAFAGATAAVRWLGVLTAFFAFVSGYFAYARWAFSPGGRDIQNRMLALVTAHLRDWSGEGKVLDVGCGDGALAIRIAKDNPDAHVLGVDKWGANWEFSRRRCEDNAAAEGVGNRVSFEDADAASLPFDDAAFDAVVSNFVFHEVRSVSDKRRLLQEALRVLKPGGVFVFQDLFLWRRVYGPIDGLLQTLRGWGIGTVGFVDTSRSSFIPRALKLPFMLGTAGILYGKK